MSSRSKQCIIIGISGATCSGKSTLSSHLYKLFTAICPCGIVNQDDYFWPVGSPKLVAIPELNHANWDVPEAINYDSMLEDVKCKVDELNTKSSMQSLLFIEGFLLYNNKTLCEMCNHKYFLTLTKETCWSRRRVRTYEPPDPDGYFSQIVWPSYETMFGIVQSRNDIRFIDGSEDEQTVFHKVLGDLKSKINVTQWLDGAKD